MNYIDFQLLNQSCIHGGKSTTDVYGLYTENVKNIAETN